MSERPATTTWRGLCLAKRGHGADEYEDAFAADPGAGRFAVADGASESSFAGAWARLLVDGFVRKQDGPNWLAAARRDWAAQVDGRPLPWYAEAKREQGAFATFLGLVLGRTPEGEAVWRALAVGDSCLFQVSRDRLVERFPVSDSRAFGNQPHLLGARAAGAARGDGHAERRGSWRPGDRFLLATDALAQWFLSRHEAGERPWEALAGLGADDFGAWVEECRERDGLRNDDVTLVVIEA